MASAPRRAPRGSGKPFRRAPLFVLPLEDRTLPAPVAADTPQHGSGCCCAVCGKDFMPQPYSYFVPSGFLTDAQEGDRDTVARNALVAFTGTTGLTPDDVAAAAVSDSYTSQGLSHVYFRQQLRGLPVINSTAGVHLMADGRAVMVNASLVPNLAATPADPAPAVDPVAAVVRAAAEFGYDLRTPPELLAVEGGSRAAVVVSEPEFSDRGITVQRAYLNTERGVRPVWELVAVTPDGEHGYHVTVDTQDGAVEFWSDWVAHFGSYNALPGRFESPLDGPRAVMVNPADPVASPFGWHDTNGVPGGEFTDTRGNNVFAQEDQDANNAGGFRPDGGAARVFDFPFNQALPPTGYVPAAVTNLFFANNFIHDVAYRFGFDEASGNFQQKNYTGNGLGNDAVQADALDGSGTDNANFFTPPDGSPGRMQMFVFAGAITGVPLVPNPTSDFDNGIIYHEFGHGISNRLTGGPGNASALTLAQPRSMGEGWSDFFALMLSQRPTDLPTDRYPIGSYVLGAPAPDGIRGAPLDPTGAPYSFSLAVNTMTFAQVGTGAGQVNPAAGFIHNTGARWCSALWDLNWLLIDKLGYDPDLSTGYAPGGGPAGAGNKLTLRLVMDGMKLQQVNPTFIQARDAILMADVALTGGQNHREIWQAFARRGLGFSASTASASSGDVNEAFDLPPTYLNSPGVIAQSPAGATAAPPAALTVTFSEPMDPLSFDVGQDVPSFTGPGGVNLLPAVTTFAWGGGNTTLTINFTPQTAQGAYALTLGPNILAADNGAAMNQDFDTNVGEAIQDRYTARFAFDAAPLTVTAITPATGATTPVNTAAVDVTFSEPVLASSLAASDLNLSQGTVTGASQIAPNQVRFNVTGFAGSLGEATIFLSLKYGAVTDAAGFASQEFNSRFTLDYDTTAFLPNPLFSSNPLGSLAYEGTFPLTTLVGSPTDTDNFTVTLDAGQTLSAIVTPAAGLAPSVTISDAGGSSGTTAPVPGATVAATRSTGGPVTVTVAGTAGTTGGYSLRLLLNASGEGETFGGASNDSTATAQSLDAQFNGPFAGVSTASVAGFVEPTGKLPAEIEPNNTTATANDATRNFNPTASTVYQLGWAGNLAAAGDNDWVNIGPMQAGDVLTISQSGGPSGAGSLSDSFVELWRAGGGTPVSVTTNDDGGVSLDSYIYRFNITTADTYYIRSKAFLDAGAGTYRVGVRLENAGAAPATGGGFTAEAEANNSLATANDASTSWRQVQQLAATTGSVTAGDADVIRYTFTAGDRVTVRAAGATGFIPRVALLDANGTSLQFENGGDFVISAESSLYGYVIPATGTYFVQVSAASGTGNYTLNVFQSGTAPQPAGNAKDHYSLTLAAGELVSLGLVRTGTTATLDLLGTDGTTVLASGTAAGTYSLALTANAPAAGTYFVRVFDPTPADYQLTAVRGATVDREGNDTLPAAQPVAAGVPALGGLTAADEDWYRVTVPAGLPTLRVRTSTPGDAAGQFVNALDPVVEVYDPLDNLVVLNDNGAGDGRNALAFVGNVPAGTYSIRVRAANGLTTGEYVLAADLVPNAPPTGLTPGGPYTVAEGGTLSLLGSASDIDGDILAYAWDLNNDGVFTDAAGQNPVVSSAALDALGLGDGPFSGPVFVRVDDGRNPPVVSAAGTLSVTNSPPTGTAANDGPAPEGTAAPFSVSVAATDPSSADVAAGFTYSYDFDNDGTFDLVNVPSPSATIPAALLGEGPATQTVAVRVTDQDGDSTVVFTTITVTGVGPTGTLTGSGTVPEGTAGSVAVTGVTDPSLIDTAAGFRYAYDFDNDGAFERGDGSYAGSLADSSSVVPARFLSNGPFTRTVRVRVIDVDNDFTDLTTTIDVVNGNPTARAEGVQAVEGSSPGGFAVLDATDPSADDVAAGFRYSFDFDNDGTFDLGGAGYAAAVDTNVVSVPASFVPEGPAVLTVRARVWDQNDGFFDTFADVIVNNVAPQAVFTGSPPVAEGGAANVSFSGQTDPSPTDLAGLRYAYDFDNDGTWDIGGATYAAAVSQTSAAVPPQFLTDGPGNTVVRGRVIDEDGGFTDYAVTISVTNSAPTASFAAGGPVPEGSPGQVTFANQADVSPADVAAGFRYSFDFDNDGVFDLGGITYATAVPTASVAVPGKFTGASGTRVVRGRIFDQDGGFADYTANLTVTNVDPQATLTAGGPVPEGTTGRVTFSGIIDPSPVDVAGMRFAFDFDSDGTFDLGGPTYASAVSSPVADVPAAFLADGPFSRTVTARVIDPDGGFNDYTTTVQVVNVAPVAGLQNGGPVAEGQPGSVTATAVDSAADLAALRYSFDFDNDGTFEVVGSTSPTAAVPAGDSGQRTVRVRITDKDGGSAEATTTIAVGNVAPTGTLGTAGPVVEGADGLVSFAGLFDPSAADAAAGFRFSFDFDNDGTFEVVDSASPSAAVPAATLGNGPADRLVRGRVADKDGGFTDYTVLVPVVNAAPVGTLSADPAVPVGQPSTVRFTNVTDAAADLAAGLTYSFEFAVNGNTTVVTGVNPVLSFTFPAAGTYTVIGRITDRDGGTNEDAVSVTVSNVGPGGALTGAATQQGGSASVSFTGVAHPSSAAGAAGFRYSFDFDNDGTFDVGDGTYAGSVTSPTAAVPAGLLLDAGTRTVRGRVVEVNGGFTDMTAAVTVANVAPTAVVSAPVTPVPAGTPVTISLVNPSDPSPADTAAGFLYSFDTNADGKFEVVNSKSPSVTVTPAAAGTLNVVARITDQNGGSTTKTVTLTAVPPAPTVPPPTVTPRVRGFAVGTDAGTSAQAALYDDAGTLLFFGNPLGTEFTGGVRVAAGDVNFDGVPDLAAGTGPGRASLVRVISGKDGSTLFQTAPFEAAFTGGVYVSLGDIDGDGKAELAVSPDEGGGPRVTVFRSGPGGMQVLTDYFGIDDPAFRGGARTAFGDVNRDGNLDLIVAAGFGGGPRLSVWDGASLGTPAQKTLFNDFFVFEQTLRNGVFVTGGDIDGDGFADVIAGGGPGGAPRVFALSGQKLLANQQVPVANFFAGDTTNRGGVRLVAADFDRDGRADLLAGSGAGAGSRLTRYSGAAIPAIGQPPAVSDADQFPGFLGGLFVG